jgi:hypothetical protein
MDEMEEKHIKHDSMTYHIIFSGLKMSNGIEGVCELSHKMVERNFVAQTRTVVMLMKILCENRELDLGLNFWNCLVEKGSCPHGHALIS